MKRTEARMKVLTALKLEAGRGNVEGLKLRELHSRSRYRAQMETLRAVLILLLRGGQIKQTTAKRPFRYAITTRGLLAMGSFPALGDKRHPTPSQDDLDKLTRKHFSQHAKGA